MKALEMKALEMRAPEIRPVFLIRRKRRGTGRNNRSTTLIYTTTLRLAAAGRMDRAAMALFTLQERRNPYAAEPTWVFSG